MMYDTIGDQVLAEIGASDGFDASYLINAAAEAANRGVKSYAQDQQQKQSAADIEAKAQAVIALDAQATNSEAQATYSAWVAKNSAQLASVNPALSSQATADQAALSAAQMAAQQARAAEASAAVGLPPEAQAKRLKAARDSAQKASDASVTASQAAAKAPQDVVKRNDSQLKAAIAAAWQATVGIAATGAAASAPGMNYPPIHDDGGHSFLTKMRWGAPTYVWAVGVPLGVGALVLGLRAIFRRKR